MTADKPLTKRMREFLEWIKWNGPVKLWPVEWSAMHKKARDLGYIEIAKINISSGFTSYEISHLGRKKLS